MNFINAPRVSPSEQFKILLPISKPVKIPLNVNRIFHYNKIEKKMTGLKILGSSRNFNI